jgi:hypothetical protein
MEPTPENFLLPPYAALLRNLQPIPQTVARTDRRQGLSVRRHAGDV